MRKEHFNKDDSSLADNDMRQVVVIESCQIAQKSTTPKVVCIWSVYARML